jgi:membrane protein DedA with SNARE-associated domain
MESVLAWLSHYGYAGLFGLLVLGIVGLPIPDETLLVFSGYLISTGRMHAPFAFCAGFGGSICGISLSYWIGRTVGHSILLRYGRYVHITKDRLDRVHGWFQRVGEWLLTFGYFIPGVRHFTALVAGMSELEFPTFAAFAYSGAALWVTTFLTLGYFVGENWRMALGIIHRYTGAVAIGALVATSATWWLRRRVKKRSSTNSAPSTRR